MTSFPIGLLDERTCHIVSLMIQRETMMVWGLNKLMFYYFSSFSGFH